MSEFDAASSKREYLALASESLKRAKEVRQFGGPRASTYAALELRFAFEALIYERAIDYLADLTPEEVRIWQPHALLQRIVEIDPTADLPLEFSMNKTPGQKDWLNLGSAQRIGLAELKTHYFALGSFLHAPALASLLKGKERDEAKLMKQCEKSEVLLAKVVGSPLRMKTHEIFGRARLECSECGANISRSLAALRTPQNGGPGTRETISVNCPRCVASFDVFYRDGDGIAWREQRWERACPVKDCDGWHVKWTREMQHGVHTICSSCQTEFEVLQGLIFRQVDSDNRGKQ